MKKSAEEAAQVATQANAIAIKPRPGMTSHLFDRPKEDKTVEKKLLTALSALSKATGKSKFLCRNLMRSQRLLQEALSMSAELVGLPGAESTVESFKEISRKSDGIVGSLYDYLPNLAGRMFAEEEEAFDEWANNMVDDSSQLLEKDESLFDYSRAPRTKSA